MVWWVIAIALSLLWSYGWLSRHAPGWIRRVTRRRGTGRGVVGGDGEFGLYAVCASHHQVQLERIANAIANQGHEPVGTALLVPQYAEDGDPRKVSVLIDSIEVARLDHVAAHDFERAVTGAGFADATCLAEIIGPDRSGQFGVRLNASQPFVIAPAEISGSD